MRVKVSKDQKFWDTLHYRHVHWSWDDASWTENIQHETGIQKKQTTKKKLAYKVPECIQGIEDYSITFKKWHRHQHEEALPLMTWAKTG